MNLVKEAERQARIAQMLREEFPKATARQLVQAVFHAGGDYTSAKLVLLEWLEDQAIGEMLEKVRLSLDSIQMRTARVREMIDRAERARLPGRRAPGA